MKIRPEIDELQFHLNGILDEVKIFDTALNPDQIATLKTLWNDEPLTNNEEKKDLSIKIFPNPSKNAQFTIFHPSHHIYEVQLSDLNGRIIPVAVHSTNLETKVICELPITGLYILYINFQNEVVSYKVVFP